MKHTQAEKLTKVVPDIHFSAEGSDLDNALTQKVIRFPLQTLLHTRLYIVIFIPHTQFNAVR